LSSRHHPEHALAVDRHRLAVELRVDPPVTVIVDQLLGTASHLVISRRSPSMVMTTLSLSASTGNAGRFLGRGPRGLADWPFLNRLCTGGLPRPTS